MPRPSRRSCGRPASTRKRRAGSATTPGRCCSSTPATSADTVHTARKENHGSPGETAAKSGSAVGAIDRVLGSAVEVLAAILIAAEILILFVGVIARYFLHYPLIWTDEVASILFLWLG